MKLRWAMIAILFVACHENASQPAALKTTVTPEDSLRNMLPGSWGGLGDDSPVWDIRKDSIYYFEFSKAYPYTISNHNITIHYSESNFVLKNVRVIHDTLYFFDDQGMLTKAYRFKK